ncbi:MAG TPA: TonB-dependent receptor [Candidatus Aquilonibacter sp.]|nr:TonB-dependent receptor [Candidatus Aquilonibacter sp.]
MKLIWLRLGLGAALVMLMTLNLPAQVAGRGSLSGLVADSTGAAVPSASVTLSNVATGVALQGKTSSAGLYSFISLVPGIYRLQVSQTGFQTAVQNDITVAVDQAETINVTLQLGAQTETVTVSAAEDITATTSSTTGQLINSDVINRLPLGQRDVFQLALLSPGVIPQDGNTTSLDTGRDQVSIFSINGAQQGTIYYLLDGSPLTIGENNQGVVIPALEPPEDSIQEFRMELSNTPASVETGAAGLISLVSKSGTDNFHGDAFGWIRPNGLDANDYFNKLNDVAIPNYHRYQWGGSLGGPIKKDKFFFFGDYEGTQQSTATQTTTTVPLPAELQGNFSYVQSQGVTIYNPYDFENNNCPTDSNGNPISPCPQPFATGASIPINPIAQKYLAMNPWPAPNLGPNGTGTGNPKYHTNNYFAAGSNPEADQRFDVRLDDNVTSAQHLFGRFSFHREHDTSADLFDTSENKNDIFYGNGTDFDHDFNAMIGYDYTLSSSAVLQLRASATRHYEFDQPQGQLGFNMTTLGFPQSLLASSVLPAIPDMHFGGSGSVRSIGTGMFSVFKFAVTVYDFSSTLNKVVGRHNLSLGWEFTKQFMNVGQTLSPSGWYAFDNSATSNNANSPGSGNGDAFASWLLGLGGLNDQGQNWTTDIFGANSNPYTALFVQDDWHATNKLTINAGLRWDVFPGATERFNRMEYFDPTLQYTVGGVNLTGGEVFAKPGDRSPFLTNWHDFAPRFGLTYQILKNAVIRGGFGISYGPSVHMSSINQFNDDSFNAVSTWIPIVTDASGNYPVPNNPITDPFPNGITEPTKGSLGPATNLGNTVNFVPHSAPEMTTYNFNFGVQYQFPYQTVLSVAWVGSRGLHLTFSNNVPDLNELSIETMAANQNTLLNTVPFPYTNAITDPTAPLYGVTQVPEWVMLQKYPQFSNGFPSLNNPGGGGGVLDWGATWGDSIYHSMQMKLEKHLSHGFTSLASLTWSKLITDDDSGSLAFSGNNYATPQDWQDLKLERALSTQDIPFYFSWELSYDLPIGANRALDLHGWMDKAFGGWTVSTITAFSDGQPIATPNGTGDPWFNQRPNIAGNCGTGAPKTVAEWFNYTCMTEPTNMFAAGTAGAILPGIRADGTHNLDASLTKHFKFSESKDLQITAAAYNFTNSVQFGYPNVFLAPANFGTPFDPGDQQGFGQITNQANSPRSMSFEARFTF